MNISPHRPGSFLFFKVYTLEVTPSATTVTGDILVPFWSDRRRSPEDFRALHALSVSLTHAVFVVRQCGSKAF